MTASQTPTPGVPLSAESDVQAGDVLSCSEGVGVVQIATADYITIYINDAAYSRVPSRFTFIGRPDAEGWMTWSGGANPVPGMVVSAKTARGYHLVDHKSDRLHWQHIIAFRLTTPSDQGERYPKESEATFEQLLRADYIAEPTTPAPGSDGLETGLVDRLCGPHEWGYRCPVEGDFIEDRTPFDASAAILSAEKGILALEKLNAVLSEKLERRTVENDALQSQVAALKAALEKVRDLETLSHHDGYDNGPGGGNYIYVDVIRADEAFAIIDQALALKEGR